MRQTECANCDAVLTGPYCATCGQHAHQSARTLGVLFHDAWHVITHVDGRFWRTMHALLLRPGLLTQEYFAERRARYLPPVRVYLVLSVLFFALGSAGRHSTPITHVGVLESASGNSPAFVFDTKNCANINSSFKWLEKPLREACQRNLSTGGAPVRDAFGANIPRMMFVFLPMMALVMLLLYWRPPRYYVEHLVFFLHTHAAMFLLLLLLRPLSWAASAAHALKMPVGLIKFGAGLYAVWYVYRAMRVYYAQGRWLTLTKLAVVGFAYMIFLSVTLLATLVITALTA